MSLLLLHGPEWKPGVPAKELLGGEEAVEARVVSDIGRVELDGRAVVLLLDPELRLVLGEGGLREAVERGIAVVALGREGEADLPDDLPGATLISAFLTHGYGPRQLRVALRSAYRESLVRRETAQVRTDLALRTREIVELTRIGVALSTEHDYDELLRLILSQARQITQSDAGSLYLVEGRETPSPRLRFKLAQNDTLANVGFSEYTMPLDTFSQAGYVCSTGEALMIDDVYFLPPDVEYSFKRSFDERTGYRSKSMLTVPMRNHRGDVTGALQLINRKRNPAAALETPEAVADQVIPFSPRMRDIATALAGQAAVSIENSVLYSNIEQLFEGFVQASVTAIEQRDPPTRGHSIRVANTTVALAEVVSAERTGPYRHVNFSREQIKELRYAGLLHDFGKVGVREQVLSKEKKLSDTGLDVIRRRHGLMRDLAEIGYQRSRAEYLLEHGRDGYDQFFAELDAGHRGELEAVDHYLQVVLRANEPTVLAEGSFEELQAFAARTFADAEGKAQPLLTADEVRALSIRKGSLSEEERAEIESHVQHTMNFLQMIPWTRELVQIPIIAYGHHEKLNGRGYPRKITAASIPIQTRMMTICDIFDALAAIDRPYKKPVPLERALLILEDEAKGGNLDKDLLKLFVEARVYEKAMPA
jgi:HD-GYP domain-containing protein (c-di-GMP phosphodiesterase class II)